MGAAVGLRLDETVLTLTWGDVGLGDGCQRAVTYIHLDTHTTHTHSVHTHTHTHFQTDTVLLHIKNPNDLLHMNTRHAHTACT